MTDPIRHISFPSPLGPLSVFAEDDAIIAIESGRAPGAVENDLLLNEAKKQIDGYFDGKLTNFDLPLAPQGTPRQKEIWQALTEIPYGETRTYGELATSLGSAARAVGGACGANPILIVIPCHRVLGKDNTIGGFSFDGGVDSKRQLLILEGSAGLLI